MDINKCVLDNGLRVLSVERPGFLGTQIALALRAGSRQETKRINGIAHFLEHLFFRGGARYPTNRETTFAIEGYGGFTNAYTSQDMIYFDIQIPADMMEMGVDVLSDMLLNAALRDEDIEKERGQILREIAKYEDVPLEIAAELCQSSLYGDTPFGRPVCGPRKNVKRFSRDDFVAFQSAMYNAQDAVLAIVADIPHHEIFSLAHKYFKDMPGTSSAHSCKERCPTALPGLKVTFQQKDSADVGLALGAAAPDHFANGYLECLIINTILGQGMSSRLYQSVGSEKGLAYDIYSVCENGADHGEFTCYTGVDPEKVEETLAAILAELKRLQDEPVEAEELINAKRQRSGRLSMACDHLDAVGSALTLSELLYQDAKTPHDLVHEADNVTAEGIQAVAQKIFNPGNLHLAVVGPYKGDCLSLTSILAA